MKKIHKCRRRGLRVLSEDFGGSTTGSWVVGAGFDDINTSGEWEMKNRESQLVFHFETVFILFLCRSSLCHMYPSCFLAFSSTSASFPLFRPYFFA